MYKKYLIPLGLICSLQVSAKMVYDPVQNSVYSMPLSPNINQAEYYGLLINCIELERRMTQVNNGRLPANKEIMNQVRSYLKRVGTPTALRLMEDLKKGYLFYPDGSKCKPIMK